MAEGVAGSITVAIVEDSGDTAELLRFYLADFARHFNLAIFPEGLTFLSTFQAGKYAVIILDISLPELDGFQIMQRIRAIDATVPVIGFSAHAMDTARRQAEAAGFSAYITKPVLDWQAFGETIVRLMASSRAAGN